MDNKYTIMKRLELHLQYKEEWALVEELYCKKYPGKKSDLDVLTGHYTRVQKFGVKLLSDEILQFILNTQHWPDTFIEIVGREIERRQDREVDKILLGTSNG